MKIYTILICLFVLLLSACNSSQADEILDFKVRNWNFELDDSLSERNTYFLVTKNEKDSSVVSIGERDNKLIVVSTLVEGGENVGVQYIHGTNKIDYIKVRPSFDRIENDESFLKIFKNNKGNWVLVEYSDRSEKKILRQAELK